MNNCAFVWQPKWVSPFDDKEVYLCPAVKDQKGEEWNYIIIIASKSYNGVYRYPAKNIKKYTKWKNGKLECVYVPLSDCEFFKPLEDLQNPSIVERIKREQQKWFEFSRPKKIPEWFMIKIRRNNG